MYHSLRAKYDVTLLVLILHVLHLLCVYFPCKQTPQVYLNCVSERIIEDLRVLA